METDTGYAVGGQNSPVRVDPQWRQVRLASWRSPTEHCGTAIWSAFFGSADLRGTRFNASFVTVGDPDCVKTRPELPSELVQVRRNHLARFLAIHDGHDRESRSRAPPI